MNKKKLNYTCKHCGYSGNKALKSKDGSQEVEYFSPDEIAKGLTATSSAKSKPHFGLRFTKLIPPGTG